MPFDEGQAQILRDALKEIRGIAEKRMFGGLCFMMNGNMLCGVHKDGGMFRVGKANYQEALAVPGAKPLAFTGRPMGGMVEVDDDLIADDDRRARLIALAKDFVGALPAK